MKKLLCWLLLFTINFAHAAPISAVQWHGEPFVFYSRGTPLKSVIEEVGKNYGIPMEVSSQISVFQWSNRWSDTKADPNHACAAVRLSLVL